VPVAWTLAVTGILLVGLSFRLAASASGPMTYYVTFWLGVLPCALAVLAGLFQPGASRGRCLHLVLLFAAFSFVPKFLRNPNVPLYHDEFAHWRETADVLATGHIFQPNGLIPIIQFFPGTHVLTAAVAQITGLSIWHAAELVLVTLHVLAAVAVFLVVETLVGGPRAGGVAALVYMTNSSYMYFDTQFAYESYAICYFLWVVALTVLAARASARRRRRGYAILAALMAGAVIVTHHLTTFAMVLVLGMVTIWTSVSRLRGWRAQPVWVWWSAWISGLGAATLWVAIAAPGTISYFSPYFGNAAHQLLGRGSAAKGPGGSRRTLLVTSVEPAFERALTAGALLIACLLALVGLAALWRGRWRLPPPLVGLCLFGLVYFPSVLFILTPNGAEGARRSWAFTYLGFAALAALAAAVLTSRSAGRARRRFGPVAFGVAFVVLLIGNVGGGLNDPYRFPGPFLYGSEARSETTELQTLSRWFGAHEGRVKIVTDRFTAQPMTGYAGAFPARPSTGFPAWDLFYSAADPSPLLRSELRSSNYDYVVVDENMARYQPFTGSYFDADDPGTVGLVSSRVPAAALRRFDQVPWAMKIFSSDTYAVYRLDFSSFGARVAPASAPASASAGAKP